MAASRAQLAALPVPALKKLLQAGGIASLRFVFVSACFSEAAAQAFVEAGVPHVVAVRVGLGYGGALLAVDEHGRVVVVRVSDFMHCRHEARGAARVRHAIAHWLHGGSRHAARAVGKGALAVVRA